MAASKGSSRPNKRESRPAGTERLPMVCQLGGDNQNNSSSTLQVQFLTARLGISAAAASALAPMVWGGAHG